MSTTTTTNLYQQIWDADQSLNGVPPILSSTGVGNKTDGYVKIEEINITNGRNHRLLTEVEIPESKQATYKLCQKLFDNYTLDGSKREKTFTTDEFFENYKFIEAVKDLSPMKIARDFIAEKLVANGKIDNVSDMTDFLWTYTLTTLWFREFQTTSEAPSRNGFEHVFVGEQSKSKKGDKIGGYHFWHKYWLDDGGTDLDDKEGQDRISFESLKYDRVEGPGELVPEVATFSYDWLAKDFEGGSDQNISKGVGGFFVGCSPEGLMAIATARFYDDEVVNKRDILINGNEYELKLFKDDYNFGKPDARIGEVSINTFYPVLNKVLVTSPPPTEPTPPPTEPTPPPTEPTPPSTEPASVIIVSALVDVPGNDEDGKETVTLRNTGVAAANINNWKIAGPSGNASNRFFLIEDSAPLEPGESRTFKLVNQPNRQPARLKNSGSGLVIKVYDASDEEKDTLSYSRGTLVNGTAFPRSNDN